MFVHLHQYDLNEPEPSARIHCRFGGNQPLYITSMSMLIVDAANSAPEPKHGLFDPQIACRREAISRYKGAPC